MTLTATRYRTIEHQHLQTRTNTRHSLKVKKKTTTKRNRHQNTRCSPNSDQTLGSADQIWERCCHCIAYFSLQVYLKPYFFPRTSWSHDPPLIGLLAFIGWQESLSPESLHFVFCFKTELNKLRSNCKIRQCWTNLNQDYITA